MFLPESIDLAHSEKYVLSIRLKPNGFMFSIADPENPKIYCLRETTFSEKENLLTNVQRIVFELSFLTQEYKQTNIVIVSKNYDLIPADYFDKKEMIDLYNFTHFDKANHVLTALYDLQDVVMLYGIDRDLYDFLLRSLWNPTFHHHTSLLNNLFEKRNKVKYNTAGIYLNFHDNLMDVFCFSGSKLLHCLTYENEPEGNLVYFVLKLWERFGFDQLRDCIYITGQASDSVIEKLEIYVSNVERFDILNGRHLQNEDAEKVPLDLLALSL